MPEWTLETLKTHIEAQLQASDVRYQQRFADQEKAVSAALAAAEKAVNTALISAKEAVGKAEAASEKRFESVNEFRKTLSDQATTFISRTEAVSLLRTLGDKVDVNTSRMDRIEGRTSGLANSKGNIAFIIALCGTIIGIIGTIAAIVVIFKR